mmetsp:Transcript_37632/g.119669  ORF Transcript_37632/g.119669 Transcript_37632/m.119669 type:complete len:295 (-) Transcript_37632:7-891(-)
MCFASTRVRIPSRRMCCCTKSSAKKVCATGAGSAKPVVSMSTPSRRLLVFRELVMSLFKPAMRSPRTVQQMQPLFISTILSSSAKAPPLTRASSMPTSPNSFSMTAIRLPWFFSRIWFSNVVFPLPRKPVSTETGTFSFAAACCGPLTAADSAFAFFSLRPASSGARLSAQPYSTAARLAAPRPISRSARTSYIFRSDAFCSGVNFPMTSSRKARGSFKILSSAPPISGSKRSMHVLIFCKPSKYLPSPAKASASARSSPHAAMPCRGRRVPLNRDRNAGERGRHSCAGLPVHS